MPSEKPSFFVGKEKYRDPRTPPFCFDNYLRGYDSVGVKSIHCYKSFTYEIKPAREYIIHKPVYEITFVNSEIAETFYTDLLKKSAKESSIEKNKVTTNSLDDFKEYVTILAEKPEIYGVPVEKIIEFLDFDRVHCDYYTLLELPIFSEKITESKKDISIEKISAPSSMGLFTSYDSSKSSEKEIHDFFKSLINEDFEITQTLGTSIKFKDTDKITLDRLKTISDSINGALNLKDEDGCTVNRIMMRLDFDRKDPAKLLKIIKSLDLRSGRSGPS